MVAKIRVMHDNDVLHAVYGDGPQARIEEGIDEFNAAPERDIRLHCTGGRNPMIDC